MTYSFPDLEPICCSMSSSNYCFLTCILVSQEANKVIWYSSLFKNFLQFLVIHTVKGFGIANKAETDIFLEFTCFFDDPMDVGNLISGSSPTPREDTISNLGFSMKLHQNFPWLISRHYLTTRGRSNLRFRKRLSSHLINLVECIL